MASVSSWNNTTWNKIFDALRGIGLFIYQPAEHVGICGSPYIVVKHAGAMKHSKFSTEIWLYDIMLYVPIMQYGYLEYYAMQIRERMRSLLPSVKPYGQVTPPYLDEEKQAYMISITYQNYKLERGIT